jgi:hypothetical protein
MSNFFLLEEKEEKGKTKEELREEMEEKEEEEEEEEEVEDEEEGEVEDTVVEIREGVVEEEKEDREMSEEEISLAQEKKKKKKKELVLFLSPNEHDKQNCNQQHTHATGNSTSVQLPDIGTSDLSPHTGDYVHSPTVSIRSILKLKTEATMGRATTPDVSNPARKADVTAGNAFMGSDHDAGGYRCRSGIRYDGLGYDNAPAAHTTDDAHKEGADASPDENNQWVVDEWEAEWTAEEWGAWRQQQQQQSEEGEEWNGAETRKEEENREQQEKQQEGMHTTAVWNSSNMWRSIKARTPVGVKAVARAGAYAGAGAGDNNNSGGDGGGGGSGGGAGGGGGSGGGARTVEGARTERTAEEWTAEEWEAWQHWEEEGGGRWENGKEKEHEQQEYYDLYTLSDPTSTLPESCLLQKHKKGMRICHTTSHITLIDCPWSHVSKIGGWTNTNPQEMHELCLSIRIGEVPVLLRFECEVEWRYILKVCQEARRVCEDESPSTPLTMATRRMRILV